MRRIINKETIPGTPISLQDVCAQDVIMVGTRLLEPNDRYNVIVIGTIPPRLGSKDEGEFHGLLHCNIDYDSIDIEDFELVSTPYFISVQTMEDGIKAGKLRAYAVSNLRDIKEAIQDILVWHGFPK